MQTRIFEAEESVQDALESLRNLPVNAKLTAVLDLLAPQGYHPVVELQENGRKKRRNASLDNWTPKTGEILISFEPDVHGLEQKQRGTSSATEASKTKASVTPEEELCMALEEVERQHWSFVALKRFRDEVLPSKGYTWAADQEKRQAVLASAVEKGLVLTSKIPNPRSPFPTTTIRLNRSRMQDASGERRFAPVQIKGEALSSTILRDRGSH